MEISDGCYVYFFVPQVVRLLYTNNGIALLALGSNAVHKLWKWQRGDRNPSGKVRPENFTLINFDCNLLCLLSEFVICVSC
jgi:hypothetical protein